MSDTTSNKKKVVRIVFGSIFGLILLIIFIIEGVLLVQKYIKKSPVPLFMGYASLRVITGSMSGTINKGDMIIIKKTDDYQLGDIVTFIEEGGVTVNTHRLVNYGNEEGTFITKGDANNTVDSFSISKDQIVGEVVYVIPKLGLVFDWFLSGGGIIYTAALIVVVIFAVFILKRKDTAEEEADSPTQMDSPAENIKSEENVKTEEDENI